MTDVQTQADTASPFPAPAGVRSDPLTDPLNDPLAGGDSEAVQHGLLRDTDSRALT